MSGVSLPVSRPAGRALLIGSLGCRAEPLDILQRLGFQCAELDDPYAAMAELTRRPLVYWALVLSLNSLFREELGVIAAVKRRWPHVEVWLTNTDGRAAAMTEAMRLGADGLLLDDGFHRSALSATPENTPPIRSSAPLPPSPSITPKPAAAPPPAAVAPDEPVAAFAEMDSETGEPILSAEELRALLQDPPFIPSSPFEEEP